MQLLYQTSIAHKSLICSKYSDFFDMNLLIFQHFCQLLNIFTSKYCDFLCEPVGWGEVRTSTLASVTGICLGSCLTPTYGLC